MNLSKYHALGNDYWVYDPNLNDNNRTLDSIWVKKFCNRHTGLGGDGILVGPKQIDKNCFAVEIYNSDGTLAEISGNGLTIFSRYLCNAQRIKINEPFCLLPSEKCRVHVINIEENNDIYSKILLGKGEFVEIIKYNVPADLRRLYTLPAVLDLYKIDMGNPHCVVPVEKPIKELACDLGKILEYHPAFPHKTNVQFVHWNKESFTADIEIWERGSGYTLGSGSSSCAVACAFGKYFALDNYTLTIKMPGGQLAVTNEHQMFSFTNCAHKIADIKIAIHGCDPWYFRSPKATVYSSMRS